MPKRTNDFQDLVALVERALAPRGAKITESALIGRDRREIDVLIETSAGPYSMKIAVEAKDEGRKMDIGKFESIVAKYSVGSRIRVNQVVVVSRRGFYEPVVKRAKREGIKLLTLEKALAADWARAVPQVLSYRVAPHIGGIEFHPPIQFEAMQDLIAKGRIQCNCCDKDHGSPHSIAMELLQSVALRDLARETSSRNNSPVCVKTGRDFHKGARLSINDAHFEIQKIIVHIHCTEARAALEVSAYKHGQQTVHHLRGHVAGVEIQFVVPEGTTSRQIALKIQSGAKAAKPEARGKSDSALSAEIISLVDMADWLSGRLLVDRLRMLFAGTSVAVHQEALVHNYATGADVRVSFLIEFFLAPSFKVRTAIVMLGDGSDFLNRRESLRRLAREAEVDRIIAIGGVPVAESLSDPDVLHVSNLSEVEAIVFPRLLGFTYWVDHIHLDLFSDQERVETPSAGAEILVGDKIKYPIMGLLNLVQARIVQRALWLVYSETGFDRGGNSEFHFSLDIPLADARVSHNGRVQRLTSISGSAVLHGSFLACRGGDVATVNGRPMLEFRPDAPTGFVIRGGTFPVESSVALDGGAPDLSFPSRPSFSIPSSDWDSVFPPGPLPVPGTHKYGKIDLKANCWTFHIFRVIHPPQMIFGHPA